MATSKVQTDGAAASSDRLARLEAIDGPPQYKQLNTRVPAGLAGNLAFVSKLTGESAADIVVEAVQAAVDARLARPEIRAELESLLERSRAVAAS